MKESDYMEELKLVKPTIDYKEDALAFLEEVRVADVAAPWQYAGMSGLEKCNGDYASWIVEKKMNLKEYLYQKDMFQELLTF